MAKLLLDHHAQVDIQGNDGASALMFASEKRHTEVAKLLYSIIMLKLTFKVTMERLP